MIKNEQVITVLTEMGFSENEAKIYLILLEFNETVPSAIARQTKIKRANTYAILENLQKRGLITSVRKNNHLYFRAVNPALFLLEEEKKCEHLKQSVEKLKNTLPEIASLHKQFTQAPQMSIFKGQAGLIQIMEDTLTSSTELLCWADITLATNTILEDYYPKYIKQKIQKQVPLRGIFCHDKTALGFKKRGYKEIREIYTIPKKKISF